MTARLLLPGVLAELTGGSRTLALPAGSLQDLFAALDASYPVLGRRLRDETGAIRRYVNVYVDGVDVRGVAGLQTPVPDGAEVHVLPSVAGG